MAEGAFTAPVLVRLAAARGIAMPIAAGRISPRAALFIHTERDTMVPVEEARTLHAKAGEPKKLVIIPGMDHKEVYQEINAEVFEVVMKETVDWYDRYL